jgi:hypothetical protein
VSAKKSGHGPDVASRADSMREWLRQWGMHRAFEQALREHADIMAGDRAHEFLSRTANSARQIRRASWERTAQARADAVRLLRCGDSGGRPIGAAPGYVVQAAASAQWLVPGLVTAGWNTFYGPQEQGKTASLAAAVGHWAYGRSFAGYAPVAPLNVVWASLEDALGTSQQLRANMAGLDDSARPAIWVTAKLPPLLPVFDEMPAVPWLRRDRLHEWCPLVPDLLVVDSWTALLAANGADEVVGAARIVEALRDVCADLGCGLIVVAHTRKGREDERGNALRDAADVMIPVVCDERKADGRATFRWCLSDPAAKRRHGPRPAADVLLDFGDTPEGWRCIGHRLATIGRTTKAAKPRARDRVLAALTAEPQRLDDIRALCVDADGAPMPASSASRALAALVREGAAELKQSGSIKSWCSAS